MPDLHELGRQVVDHPVRERPSVSLLQARAENHARRRQRLVTMSTLGVAAVLVVLLVGLALSGGGGDGHRTAAKTSSQTTAEEQTTSTFAEEQTTSTSAQEQTTSTAAAATST